MTAQPNPPPLFSGSPEVSGLSYYGAPTRPLYWSVWRELWENRSIYVAPLIVAAVQVFALAISTIGIAERRRALLLLDDPVKQRAAIEAPYDMAAMMMIFVVFIVGVFYCLDALHGERRDRSILFWKSLPVSDLTTVLSKAIIPLAVLPAIAFALVVCVQLIMLLMSSANLLVHGVSPATTWAHFPVVSELDRDALRPDRDCALACADLRLAPTGFGLGAARDISLGGVATNRDPNLREDYVRHFVFRFHAETPFDGIRAACFRFPRRGPSHDRFAVTTHAGKISEQSRSMDRAVSRGGIPARSSPAAPLSRTALIPCV